MRPLRLELRGFTSFRETAVLDFEGRRLFAITGPTGAGKSSLLDAMTWALYRRVPRVGRDTHQLITHGANAMAVRLDFGVRGERYRVSRQAPGNLGSRLERQRADGAWEPLADRAQVVDDQIVALLGLDFDTFTKTVLLPQGAFDLFLRGDEPQRREILTRLLALERYAEAGRTARNRAAGASASAAALRDQVERLADAAPEAIAAFEAERDGLARKARALAERRALLDALAAAASAAAAGGAEAERAALARAEAERDLEAAAGALEDAGRAAAAAEDERERIEAERAALGYDEEAHRRLEREAARLDEREAARREAGAAEADLAAAAEAADGASERAAAAGAEAERADEALARAEESHRAALGALAGAEAAARAAEGALGEAANAADDARAEAERAAAECAERARALGDLAERQRARREDAAAAGRALGAAREAHEAAQRGSEAASERLREAEASHAAAVSELETAQRRDAALTLQRGLSPGDPCPVCGEPVGHVEPHPAPALDAAREALDAAAAALDAARGDASNADGALAAANARASGAADALDAASAALAEADAALAEAGADPADPAAAVASAREDARRERESAAEAAEARDLAAGGARALGLLRASIGEALAGREEQPPAEGEAVAPEAAREALDAAIARQREAASDAARALDEARRAGGEAAAAASEAARAGERREHAGRALEGARARLAAFGDAPDDADSVRAALAEAQRRAARHGELAAALAEAERGVASAAAHGEAARTARERAEARAAHLADAAAEADAEAAEARERLGAAWRAAGAEGGPDASRAEALRAAHEAERLECAQALAVAGQRLEAARAEAERAASMRGEAEGYEADAALAGALDLELRRNRFIAWVQREAMQLLAADAAERLLQLSSGRYRLAADGDAFAVIDGLNGDERRSVKTLSGGETFLASLALALALSERLPEIAGRGGAMSLESLFLDEGFGSLDQESLDVAIGGLETLAGGRRLVGVISHVPDVAERLPDRVEVVRRGATSAIRDAHAGRAGRGAPPDAREPSPAASGGVG